MGIPIAELQERVSSLEFAEYWAFYSLEPFGEERADLRTGILGSTIANANRDPKKQSAPFTPDQFMPRFEQQLDDEEELPDGAELAAKVRATMEMLGAPPAVTPEAVEP